MKDENQSSSGWPVKRVAAFVLTLGQGALAIYSWRAGVGDDRLLWLIGGGVVLGFLYVVRGGSLPEYVYRKSKSHWRGTGITTDDDPRNIPVKVYLPILLIVTIVAAAIYFFYAPRR